jgi:hypothetical protein
MIASGGARKKYSGGPLKIVILNAKLFYTQKFKLK